MKQRRIVCGFPLKVIYKGRHDGAQWPEVRLQTLPEVHSGCRESKTDLLFRSHLLSLPLELREMIYAETFEYGAVFYLTEANSKPTHARPMEDGGDTWYIWGRDNLSEYLVGHDEHGNAIAADPNTEIPIMQLGNPLAIIPDFDDATQLGNVLTDYPAGVGVRIPERPCTPLWSVNKEVRAEIKRLHSRMSHEDLARESARSLLYGNALSQKQYDFCRKSRFELHTDAIFSLVWLVSLPEQLRSCIRSLVIPELPLYLDSDENDTWRVWARRSETGNPPPFIQTLRQFLPCLNKVAIHVELDCSDPHYAPIAPQEVCEMLEDGTIDVVRLLFSDHVPDPANHYRVKELELFKEQPAYKKTGFMKAEWKTLGLDAFMKERLEHVSKEHDRIEALEPKFDIKVEWLDTTSGAEEIRLRDRSLNTCGYWDLNTAIWTGPQPFCFWSGARTVAKLTRRTRST